MRARLWLVLGLLVLPATAGAQRLPDEVLTVLQEECDARPGPMPDDRAFGDLLNAVAWRTRHLGMGLSRKAGGKHVDSPVGPVAEDILCDRATGHHWDVIGGADVGLPLQCSSKRYPPDSIGVMADPNRPCVPPVEPAGSAPTPTPSPTPTPAPAPAPTVDLSEVLVALSRIDTRLGEIETRIVAIESRPAPSLDLFAAYVDDMIGNGPGDNPSVVPNHVTDLKKRLDVIRVDLEQISAWLRSRSALRW